MSLISTNATIVGSKIKIKRGSKINSITVKLGNVKHGLGYGTTGRHLGLAYWVIDKEFNKCNMKINPNNPPNSMHWFDSAHSISISGVDKINYGDFEYKYINTNLIPGDTSENVTFTFNNPKEITESEIFVALIATRGLTQKDLDDVKYAWTCYDKKESGVLYSKVSSVDSNEMLIPDTTGSLNIINVDVTLPSSDTSGNFKNKPVPIYCDRISYRTWSTLLSTKAAGTMTIKIKDDKDKDINIDHQIAVADGGETCGYLYNTDNATLTRQEIIKNNSKLLINGNSILPYIMNDDPNETKFINDFEMPMGRFSDVEYDRPSEGGFSLSGNSVIQPRWCFKRSRIKFEIPGINNSKYGTIVQYLVRTPISKKGIYSIEPKYKFYNKSDTQKGFSIVICPRDEGVLDNMPFEVVFTRYYANDIDSKIGYKSDDSIYKFHTYQKPIVNITYPKIIRNDSTWVENINGENKETRNFKYAKIPTSNIYSNFDGEQANRNKYVCDALNVLFSTPKNDDSGIPMFVRFYVAEFKYGRDGCIGYDEKGNPKDASTTSQDLFKSHDKSKYTSLSDILDGKAFGTDSTAKTAELTNIFNNDGSPLLLSGRFNAKTLKEVGTNYHLWTFNTWDGVVEDDEKDVKVFNAWTLTKPSYKEDGTKYNKVISKDIIGDHKAKGIIKDIDAEICEYPVSKMLLFRAGYCYLIRIRMFHGAAAGAISKKYGKTNETCIGKEGTGDYTYKDAIYAGSYPIDDGPQYGNNNPYNKWHGPDDGTSGLSLNDSKLNETFPGFSQVDYTIFEAVTPYSSKSNLISVHPTSPNISVNQCLSFNYRHLAKNIGGIDTVIFDGSKINTDGYFGKTFGGIHNTISRIMAMYTSCVETILSKYFTCRTDNNVSFYNANKMGISDVCNGNNADVINGTSKYEIDSEKLTLKIKPIDGNGRIIDNGSNILSFTQTTPKEVDVPLINKYDVNGIKIWGDRNNPSNPEAMTNWRFYTHDYNIDEFNRGENLVYNGKIHDCGCYHYNEYRIGIQSVKDVKSIVDLNSSGNNVKKPFVLNPYKNDTIWMWPERNIIYKTLKGSYSGSLKEEPLGNVYRWQPVINAMQYDNGEIKELQIQNVNNEICNKNKNSQPNSIANGMQSGSSINCTEYIYNGTNNIDGNIQTAYFYEDECSLTKGSQINMSNSSNNRFTINEFAGEVTGNSASSGYPVMQTMPSTETKHYKYFDLNSTLNTYGELFKRVPVVYDCENGIVTSNTTNFGSLGRFKDTNLSGSTSSNEIYSLDENGNNVFPLVRTTHYLYFKTYINTAFTLESTVTVKYTSSNLSGCKQTTSTSLNGTTTTHTHGTKDQTITKTFYLSKKCDSIEEGNEDSDNYIITFGNKNGISEVYAEDNNGWGRCLSADDISAMQLQPDGGLHSISTSTMLSDKGCVDASKVSGGIEVPLLVRYTPLLQPKLISETIKNKTYTSIASKNVTIKEDKYYKVSKVLFNYNNDEVEADSITLNINYPYIPEDETYTTRNINGGLDNVYFENYHVDNDTDTPNDRNEATNPTNMDFLGGYGICTAYTVLLVPSDPNLSELEDKIYNGYGKNAKYLTSDEKTNYFKNTDNHWNYFKQPNNYYKSGHIYGIRSKSQPKAGPVLVAYNVQLNEANKGEFLKNNITNNGRNNQSISLNINNLRKCKVYYEDKWISNVEFEKETGIVLNSVENKLNTGLIYDLVIVPIYSNKTDATYNWVKYNNIEKEILMGSINSQSYGSNKESEDIVHFAGSNPLVIFNYLQVNSNIIDNTGGGGSDGDKPVEPDPQPTEPKDIHKIHNTDGAIIFPNVDHELFNMTSKDNKTVKESPGFWLNNSFRLILRLPSYRTKSTIIDDIDNITIENASNGNLNSTNGDTTNDFLFNDIQIHIGKINELNKYGYPNKMESNLNKIVDKDELAKLHIISYQHYYADDVFSKKLDNQFQNDVRELATAGVLNPMDYITTTIKNEKDEDIEKKIYPYKNRFIEVNLSNVTIKDENNNDVPIYTNYPEGFYIQFRVQTAYPSDDGTCRWSPWYGGSIDGGSHWWGTNGTDYYVPIRNYSEIFTDFRNYIKDSYPGTYVAEKGFLDDIFENNKTYINKPVNNNSEDPENIPLSQLFGKGSLLSHSGFNNNSKTKPKSSIKKSYYKQGLGNDKESSIVGSEQIKSSIAKCVTKILSKKQENYEYEDKVYNIQKNNDWPYKGTEKYIVNHNHNINLLKNDTSRLWEMLYIDFIIRNMCKLYYKPKGNNTEDCWNGSEDRNKNLKYHLSVPYDENSKPIVLNDKTWGWDDTEYNLFNKIKVDDTDFTNQHTVNEDKSSKENHINGPRLKYDKNKGYWDLNKYYRKPITKNDFDELNQHLIDLTNFIGHSLLTGKNDNNYDQPMIENILSIKATLLEFNKTRKAMIGSSLDITIANGIGYVNNLNNQMTDINYIQKIWDNIKLLCQCYNDSKEQL